MAPLLKELTTYLDNYLQSSTFEDLSLNGLQVESSNQKITKIGLAVDAGERVIEAACAQEVSLLIVHHGLFWGKEQPISGAFGRKIRKLLSSGCSLYCSHLPLDAHPEVGNNAQLAKFYGLSECAPFSEYRGKSIGIRGILKNPQSLSALAARSATMIGSPASILTIKAGIDMIKSVGIVSGSASSALNDCAKIGLDLLITGEPKQEAYHLALELGVNALFVGHYATETFGVRALGDHLKSTFEVSTTFVDLPTGI